MTKYTQTKTINKPQKELFEIVTDVKEYKNFIPGCQEIEIIEQNGNHMVADLTAGFKGINYKYRSNIIMHPNERVIIKKSDNNDDSTIQNIESHWEFIAIDEHSTKVNFFIQVDIKSSIMRIMMETFFDEIVKKVMNSFMERASRKAV